MAAAQWNDDAHHAAHVLATGERHGYYADYADRPLWWFGRALADGFAYQGEPSRYRAGAPRGELSRHLPPLAFVDFLQNHDQVGNRPFGERIAQIADLAALRALVACVLLAPAVPMLFMGEEFAASAPFMFFCDFPGPLALAVSHGRREGYARFGASAPDERVPDPNDETTFVRCRLDWAERERGAHAQWLALYTALLRLRQERLVPHLRRGAQRRVRDTCTRPTRGALADRRARRAGMLAPAGQSVQAADGARRRAAGRGAVRQPSDRCCTGAVVGARVARGADA